MMHVHMHVSAGRAVRRLRLAIRGTPSCLASVPPLCVSAYVGPLTLRTAPHESVPLIRCTACSTQVLRMLCVRLLSARAPDGASLQPPSLLLPCNRRRILLILLLAASYCAAVLRLCGPGALAPWRSAAGKQGGCQKTAGGFGRKGGRAAQGAWCDILCIWPWLVGPVSSLLQFLECRRRGAPAGLPASNGRPHSTHCLLVAHCLWLNEPHLLQAEGQTLGWTYDIGDQWRHVLTLVQILPEVSVLR